MAWHGDRRKQELPPDWQRRIRPAVMRRDGWRCTWPTERGRCTWTDPTGGTLDVDHVGDRHNHDLSNLRTLCRGHHRQRTAAQGVAARPTRQRKATPHPGMLPGA